jgi:hypothetical protein
LYIWTGAGWYNVALINQTPAIQSILDSDGLSSPFVLSNEGATTTITMIAADPDGFPVSYIAVADSDFNAMATVSQLSNVFTITPTAIQSSTGTITFKASDGINLASEISTFILTFIIANSRYTSLLVQSVGSNNGTNSTFTDASANNLTLTAAGNTVATTFSPYRDGGYSTHFDGASDYLQIANDTTLILAGSLWTIECWVKPSGDYTSYRTIFSKRAGTTSYEGYLRTGTGVISYYNGINHESSTVLDANSWSHCAWVYDGANINIYVNGVIVKTSAITMTEYNHPIVIGGVVGQPEWYQGDIRDFRIIKGTALYTSNFTPPIGSLTAITGTALLTCQSNRFVDNSVSAHAITVLGNTSVVPYGPYDHGLYDPAVNGGSVYFDGVGDYLSIPSNANLDFGTGDFTIECWVYSEPTTNTYPSFISSITGWSAGASGHRFDNINYANKFWFGLNGSAGVSGGDPFMASASTFMHYAWYHYALVRTGNTWKMYINGALEATGTYSGAFNQALGGMRVGASGPWDGAQAYSKGNVSNLRIVKGTAVYTSAFTPPTEPLTAISGTSLLINGTDGSIIDASQTSALTLVGNTKSSTTQIKYGNSSMYFDGAGDYVSIPSSTNFDFGTGDFTLETWANLSALSTNRVLIDKWSTGNVNSWQLYWRSSGTSIVFYVGSTIVVQDPNPSNIVVGEWNHIALSKSGTTVRLFINGIVVATNTSSVSYTNTRPIGLGVQLSTATNYLSGYMQDVRITKGLARYTTTFTPPAALLEG